MSKKKIVAIIEARMTSTRLPGKVLMKVAGEPLLAHMIERVKTVLAIDEVVVATTINKTDDPIQELANSLGVACFRGSEEDVMGRVLNAARFFEADVIVELTGDCPIIDPSIISLVVNSYLHNDRAYVSNAHVRSYPDGMDVQVFSVDVLERSYELITTELEREHVTLHIRNNPELFSHMHIVAPDDMYSPHLGLTLDEITDYQLLKNIIVAFKPNRLFSCLDVLSLLNENPAWLDINKNVVRKRDA